MAAKTTSGTSLDFRFVFYALDLVKNKYNLENVRGALFEIFWDEVEKIRKLF